jgi:hypothetical protein
MGASDGTIMVWLLTAVAAMAVVGGLLTWGAGARQRRAARRRDGRRAARELRWHRGEEPMPFTWYDTYRDHWEFVQDYERLCQPPPLGLGFEMVTQPERVAGGTRVTYTREAADGRELEERRAIPAV